MKRLNLKVIGTNYTTKHLEGEVFESSDFIYSSQKRCVIELTKDNKTFSFDLKLVRFVNNNVIVEGFISDEDKNVGRISFKYLS